MAEPITTTKPRPTLSPETIKVIEDILAKDATAKVTMSRDGVTVYKERQKKEYTQS